MAKETEQVLEVDLTGESYFDYHDYDVTTRFLENINDDQRARAESVLASDTASEIIDKNNLAGALALWGGEKSVFHSAVATKLLSYRLYNLDRAIHGMHAETVVTGMALIVRSIEKQRAMAYRPGVEQALERFKENQGELFEEASPDTFSAQRARTAEMAANDLFVRVGLETDADNPFAKTRKISPEIIKEWTALWQPRVWEEPPASIAYLFT